MNPPTSCNSTCPSIKSPGQRRAQQAESLEMKMETGVASLVPIHARHSHLARSPAASPWVLFSKTTVYPSRKSTMGELKLSVSDMPMLSCNYIQKGLLFHRPSAPIHRVLDLLKKSLSHALSFFPPLAGRLVTHSDGAIFVRCDDSGVPFSHCALAAPCTVLSLAHVTLSVSKTDVPTGVKDFLFDLDGIISYEGHIRPLAAVRLTELCDGAIFIGCSVNHAVVDGTSFWNLLNSWAEICRSGASEISQPPVFVRSFFGESTAVLRFDDERGPKLTFDASAPLRERIFQFAGETIRGLKSVVNCSRNPAVGEISSFQALCALMWRSVTRARKNSLSYNSTATLRLAVNCRHRVNPPVDPRYFGNAIQSIASTAVAGDVAGRELEWVAALVHDSVASYGEGKVRDVVTEWERAPRCFPLGNPDGSVLTVGSSPRFPIFDNDFGWGPPAAVRSGRANKFDGKASAFPAAGGDGGIDLELCLSPSTMAALLSDVEFMAYVSDPTGQEREITPRSLSLRCHGALI